MEDIFDQLAPEPAAGVATIEAPAAGDVFDQVAPDVFDAVAPGLDVSQPYQPTGPKFFQRNRLSEDQTDIGSAAFVANLPKAVGGALDQAGRAIWETGVNTLADTMDVNPKVPGKPSEGGMTTEQATRTYSKPVQAYIKGTQGMVESAPRLALAAADPLLGVAAFGVNSEGLDPVGAVTAFALPIIGKWSGAIIETWAAKYGVSSATALKAWNKFGGATGAAGAIGAVELARIAQMPPEQREQALVDAAGAVGGMFILGTLSEHKRPNTEKYTGPRAAKAAFEEALPGKGPIVDIAAERKPGEATGAGDVFDDIEPDQPSSRGPVVPQNPNSPTGTGGATASVPVASPGEAAVAELASGAVPPTVRRINAETGEPMTPPIPTANSPAAKIEDLKTAVADLEATIKGNQVTNTPTTAKPTANAPAEDADLAKEIERINAATEVVKPLFPETPPATTPPPVSTPAESATEIVTKGKRPKFQTPTIGAAAKNLDAEKLAATMGATFSGETPAQVPGQVATWDFRFKAKGNEHHSFVTPAGADLATIKAAMAAKETALRKSGDWVEAPGNGAPKPNWLVRVSPAVGDVPGWVSIVDPKQTDRDQSPTVESLRAAGHNVPDFHKLPQGRYTWAQAQRALAKLDETKPADSGTVPPTPETKPGQSGTVAPMPETRRRAYPAYTTAQLKAMAAGSETSPEERAKLEAEIAARESGAAPVKVTPQIVPPRAPAPMPETVDKPSQKAEVSTPDEPTRVKPEPESVPERPRGVEGTDVALAPGEHGPAGPVSGGRVGGNEPGQSPSVGGGRDVTPAGPGSEPVGGGSTTAGGNGRPTAPGATRSERDLRRTESPAVTSPGNYVITDADQLGAGTPKQKARGNLDAIKLVKLLESEQRKPTTLEQSKLVKYVGWGGIKGIFDAKNKAFAREFQELRDLLTPEEYAAARQSIQDAHYTSQTVIQRGIYAALRRFGFPGGKMVEGGVGIGNFIGLMPAEMRALSSYLGVEQDHLTAKIASYLYPEARILNQGFQDANLAKDGFDGAVGNPPFGNKRVFDKHFPASSKFTIHNYFIAKTLELTKPGGVTGFVVSRYFLDNADPTAREHVASLGQFLGAIRLPNTAFKANAGTEVVTDLVFFKRWPVGASPDITEDWTKVADYTDPKTGLTWKVNQWIKDHPEMILGDMTQAKHGLYNKEEMSVEPRPGQDLGADLTAAVAKLPAGVYEANSSAASKDLTTPEDVTTNVHGAKVGGYFVDSAGQLRKRVNDVNAELQSEPVTGLKEATEARIRALIPVRNALNDLVRLELDPDASDAAIGATRAELNRTYDAFVKKFGFINSATNRRAFYDDEGSTRILGLERDYSPGISAETAKKNGIAPIKPSAKKADIFQQRVNSPYREITRVDTPKEALMASLNQRGIVDPDYMAEITGMPKADVLAALEGLVFENPRGGYESKEQYLSGNVRQKFNEARDAAIDRPAFQKNADALQAVIPKDIDPTDIVAPVGAPWVAATDVQDFARELTGHEPGGVTFLPSNGGWMFSSPDGSVAATQTWGTERLPFGQLFNLMLNGKPIAVYDWEKNEKGNDVQVLNAQQTELASAKAAEIRDKWADWIWRDKERRDRLHRAYNDNYNNYVEFTADGSHLTLPGASKVITLNPHQKNVAWRTITMGGQGLLYDHVVGAGKTFAGVASMMELRRLGRVRKWLVTVPNHLTGQWADAFSQLYPNSNVLAAKPSDFTKENRQRLFAKILTGDFDAVVLGHTALKKVGTSPAVEAGILQEMLKEITDTIKAMKDAAGKGGGTRAIAQMERTKDNLKAKLAALANVHGRDNVANFEELGFDGLFVDEAHEFKNLFYTTQMQNVAGLGTPAGSAKAFDLYLKTRFLRQHYGGRAPIVFATGTPISNSLVEMFTMQRYLQPQVLEEMNLKTLDAWARVFAEVRAVHEVDPTGTGYRMANRFANFQNVGELTAIYKTMADVITMNDLQAQAEAAGKRFPVPKVAGGKPENIVVERSPQQAAYFGIEEPVLDADGNPTYDADGNEITSYPKGTILWRVDNMPDDPREDNMLKLTNDARKAGLDMRLIDPAAPDHPGSKINVAVKEIAREYHETTPQKGTQLVFCDLSVPASALGKATQKAKGGALGYYIKVNDKLVAVDGTPVVMAAQPNYQFFIRKGSSGQWIISERTTGLSIGVAGDTKAETIEAGERMLSRLPAGVFDDNVAKGQATTEQLAELAAEQTSKEAEKPEADDALEASGEQGVSVDELLADQSKFSVYDDMRAKLVAAGVPNDQIAFIHDYDTPEKKMKLFKAVNAGEVRILFGSTPKLGAGTNVQERATALTHMDAPWRPSDLEQREGRILRQGNRFYQEAIAKYKNPQDYDTDPKAFAVKIKRYATALTYDTRMWQIIEHKAIGQEGFRRADRTTRTIEDVAGEAANASDMKAATSGDPAIQQEIKLRNERKKLEMLRSAWNKNRIELQNREAYLRDYDLRYQSAVDAAKAKIKVRDDNTTRDKAGDLVFSFKLPDGKTTDEKGVPVMAMAEQLKEGRRGYLGRYRGFDFSFEPSYGNQKSVYIYHGRDKFDFVNRVTSFGEEDSLTGAGLFARLDNWLKAFDREIPDATETRDKEKKTLEEVRKESGKEFSKGDELARVAAEHEAVKSQLFAKKKKKPGGPAGETLEQRLERLKDKSPPKTMAAWIPGLDPESFRAIRNTALDLAIAAVKAGRATGEAVRAALDHLRTTYQGIDEASAQADLEAALSGDGQPANWQDVEKRVADALADLERAIRRVVTPPEGMTKAEARSARNLATARFRNLRRDLLNNPDYVWHVLSREREVVRQLKALLRPLGIPVTPDGLLGREDAIRAGLTPVEVERVVALDREWEQLRGEVEKMPKRLLKNAVSKMYPKPTSTIPSDIDAPPEWLQSRLGDNSPVTDPEDVVTAMDRMRRTAANLPTSIRETWQQAGRVTHGLRAKWATMPNREMISVGKDAADNKAQILSHQVANVVLHELNRAFGVPIKTRNLMRENALTFVIESGNREGLELARQTIETSVHQRSKWAKDALAAIGYAERHWDRMKAAADLYGRLTDAEVATENASGLAVLKRSHGYVFHLQDVLENWAHLDLSGGGGAGAASPFRQIRDLATYADAIAYGINPKTLNAIDLLQRRVALGRKLINYRAWQEALKRISDPATGLPVGADVIVRIHPQDGTQRETAPAGYKLMKFAGQTVAIQNAYAGLFSALTSDSAWRQGAGWSLLMKSATTAKSMMLMFDTFHLGRLAFWNSMMRGTVLPGNPFGHTRGLTLLETTGADLRKMIDNGELTREVGEQLMSQKADLARLLNAGLNVGGVGDNIYSDWIQHLPIVGHFNRWLFEQFQRGAMTEVALLELQRQTKAFPERSPEQVARMVAKAVNLRFGNLNSQAWIKSKHAQDFARLIMLAPQWNESLLRAEAEAVKDTFKAAGDIPRGKFRLGSLGRAVAIAFIGQFIANQFINWFFRDHPTWENPEEGLESKISAWIPDFLGNSKGFFLNPMTLPAEMSHLILKGHARTGRWDKALLEAGRSRLSSFGRFADTFVSGHDQEGNVATGLGSRLGLAAGAAVPLPIGANAPLRMLASAYTGESQEQYPGQFQRQVMQTFGIKPDTAPGPEQRIGRLAREYNQAHGVPDNEEFYHSPYAALDSALKVGNLTRAKAELQELLLTHDKDTILRRYKTREAGRFTGKISREEDFLRTLTPEEHRQYDQALADRRKLKDAVASLLARAAK